MTRPTGDANSTVGGGLKAAVGIAIMWVVIAALFGTVNDELLAADRSGWVSMGETGWRLLQFGLPLAGFIYAVGWVIDVF